jgi:uncharacterized protein YbjT (DUF2867 family)
MNSSLLILGATGTVGGAVARAAVASGARVRALVRSSSTDLPDGIELVRGDLRDDAALTHAVDGARAVFYASPHEDDEEALAGRVIHACERAGARLVFVGVHTDGATRLARALRRFILGRILPHYRGKLRLSERVRTCKARPIVLMATNFFQNDEVFREDIASGVFPTTFERKVNRVDVADIADAAVRVLLDDALPSGAYSVVGPESLTSADCARTWSEVLGRSVREDREGVCFRARVERSLRGRKREDFIASFGVLRRFEVATDPRALAQTTMLLGREPTSYRSYVARVAATWSSGHVGEALAKCK